MIYDSIIIGGGPAGISAALQLQRFGLRTVLFEKNELGGLMLNANLVENYPGFPSGASGRKLAMNFKKQLENTCVRWIKLNVEAVTKDDTTFQICTDGKIFQAHTVIIATGSVPKKLNILGEKILESKRLFYDVRNIPNCHNKKIAIVGSGDIAFDYSLTMAKQGAKVIILSRSKVRPIKPLARLISLCKNITIQDSIEIEKINDNKQAIVVYGVGGQTAIVDFIIVAIGRIPSLGILPKEWRKVLLCNPAGLENKGLFLAGDVTGGFRYIGIAVGHGLNAAMKVERFLRCQ